MNRYQGRRHRLFAAGVYIAGLICACLIFFSAQVNNLAGQGQSDFVPSEFISIDMDGRQLAVARHETTVKQWRACEEAKVCSVLTSASTDDTAMPMTGINWRDVSTFIKWYRDESGLEVRLPTRAEWRHIAGAADFTTKPKLFEDPRLSWAASYDMSWTPTDGDLQPIEYFGKNEFGIFDMDGSVWEWTSSCDPKDPGLLADKQACFLGRIAMGAHEAILSDQLREPGKAGCGGGRPPTHVGFRLVVSL